jgi:G3E family GTPase
LERTVAIINEFGEIGLDHLLIETTEERFALLDNGCICCTVRGDLVEMLKALVTRRETGDLPDFDRVLLETTGLADPAPVLHTLIAEAEIAALYRIDGVVVTVDAVNGTTTLLQYAEAAKQIGLGDRLLITKSDLAGQSQVADLLARLSTINPTADIVVVNDGHVDPSDILGIGPFAPDARSADVIAWFERAAADNADAHRDHDCSGEGCSHDDHHRHAGVHSFSLLIEGPVEWKPFAQWLEYVASLRGEDLLRLKGIVNVADKPGRPVVIHGVQHVFHPPKDLDRWPSAERRTCLVFIVRDIPQSLIERTLCKFASIDATRIRKPSQSAKLQRRISETA